jgi:hypothetical protein
MAANEFNFFRTTMPDSRKADFHLGCLDGCIFIDVDKSSDGLISLSRISFDGYGCCELNEHTNYLTRELSAQFLDEINKEYMDQSVMTNIVKALIDLNKEHIWSEALDEYNLLNQN